MTLAPAAIVEQRVVDVAVEVPGNLTPGTGVLERFFTVMVTVTSASTESPVKVWVRSKTPSAVLRTIVSGNVLDPFG